MTDGFDVFVSYATSDIGVVAPFVRDLKRDGFRVWFDQDQMASGLRIFGRLADAIAGSSHMIVCLSDAYIRRDWTAFELDSNQYLDPANRRNRTIPVIFRPLALELPRQIRAFSTRDITDPAKYDAEYRMIVDLLRRDQRTGPTELDRAELKRACEAPFKHSDEPSLALFQVRRGTVAIARFLYRECIGNVPTNVTLEMLIANLLTCEALPEDIKWSLETVQRYGNIAVRDGVDEIGITPHSIRPGISAFEVLSDWTFAMYLPGEVLGDGRNLWNRLPNILPVAGGRDERRIPDTSCSYTYQPRIGTIGRDPLYRGHSHEGDEEPVLINLVDLPEPEEAAFFARIAQFSQSETSTIVTPLSAGRVAVNGARQCVYVALPWVDGVSVYDLVQRFGTLPRLAALQLSLGIGDALLESHRIDPMLMHGAIDIANVLVDRFGAVRMLCGYAETGDAAEATNLSSWRSAMSQLLPDDTETAGILQRLAASTTTRQAHDALAKICQGIGDDIDLAALIGCYHEHRDLADVAGAAVEDGSTATRVVPAPAVRTFGLLATSPIESRGAWPLGGSRVLVWEASTRKLAIFSGQKPLWRDSHPIDVRRVARGPGGRLAVGGWDGHVRFFVDGAIVAAIKLDGSVGDLRISRDRVIAGWWKGSLWSISADGCCEELLGVDMGVHRIAVNDNGDRFAVADLAGGLSMYSNNVRTAVLAASEISTISDIAFAGSRLVVLMDEELISLNVNGRLGPVQIRSEAFGLLPGSTPGSCRLLVERGGSGGDAASIVQELWTIDEAERQVLDFTFPAGYSLRSTCDVNRRFILAMAGGAACAYWRAGVEHLAWTDATAAGISPDGQLIAVSRPGRVELYEDPLECQTEPVDGQASVFSPGRSRDRV